MNLTIELEGKPPVWAKDAIHYFENEHSEQWIALVVEDRLLISGLDIGWEVIEFTLEQARAELDHVMGGKKDKKNDYPLDKWILNKAELFWVLSVIQSSLISMEWRRRKLEEK